MVSGGLIVLGLRDRLAIGNTTFAALDAAVVGQITDQAIHGLEVGTVDELATFPPLQEQAGTVQRL